MQIVHERGRQVVGIEHIGSAHEEGQFALLMEIARQRLHLGQETLDLGPAAGGSSGVGARIRATRSRLLWQVLTGVYERLGFGSLGDEAFAAMAGPRIIEPTSKADTIRVLGEVGAPCPSLRTVFRSLQRCQERDYRGQLATACLAHSAPTTGKAALIMYDVTTLHFENENENEDEDSLRRVGMSKEHRIDPQVQVGLLVDPGGFPLEVHLFEGNKGETTTLPS